ncbi:putative methyltransferase tdiE [Lachnellula arida]|uniref:Putative methyltransferase tdiE n=1 Tax=Lachnellula arida TaxID=1316785 RepID=A0A8T9BAV3_9HELO|nr:putative methyltransferase tdiE [Lachnellula arida]
MAPNVSPSRSPPTPDPSDTSSVHHPQVGLEAEADNQRDDDSAIFDDGSVASSTTSISSSIMKHREENGRTYHSYKEGKYLYPNDEVESDRLDLQHHIYTLCYDGKLISCPIDKDFQVQRVLDVGTGTGIWAIDYGIDLSPSQPTFLPPNVTFEIDDIEEPWTFSQKFDFIHARMVTSALADVPKFFDQAFEYTTPGGYIELSDITVPICCDDGTMKDDSAMLQWILLLREASNRVGRDLNVSATYKAQLERVGYTHIVEKIYVWPMNRWPKDPKFKELGIWTCENMSGGVGGLSMALFTRVLGWSVEEVEGYLVNVRKEIKDTKIHSYWNIRTVYGRKPLDS